MMEQRIEDSSFITFSTRLLHVINVFINGMTLRKMDMSTMRIFCINISEEKLK